MSETDRDIREALEREEQAGGGPCELSPSIYEQVLETFRGRNRWLTLLGVFWGLVFMGLGVYSAVRFFHAEQTRELLLWAAACGICFLCVSLMKIWYWMELNKNALTREIKRLELQVALLASRMRS